MGGLYNANPYGDLRGADAPHVARYCIARGFVEPGETVLDAGCGTGYGSHMLAKVAKRVFAVDAEDTVNSNWRGRDDNIEFSVLHLGKEKLPEADVTICIEAAEHINGLKNFISEVHKRTKRLIFICTPLGGTSYAYTDEEKATPAGENNDFNNQAHLQSLFATDGWRVFTSFDYGYSGIIVLVRE